MDVVIDTSALIATIAGEPEKEQIVRLTSGHTLIGPDSIPWEIGNAFSLMLKKGRLNLEEAQQGIAIFQSIPIRYISTDFNSVLALAFKHNMYAYDAYFLDCTIRHNTPLLTLDRQLVQIAKNCNVTVWEI
ncbi:MAG: type II toxin-antitoxin system VapC family toxin [Desulfobacterales bacterium]|nr:type II toxin-antitoxin system VapC family toxin [Desulfobacterales bacterium]